MDGVGEMGQNDERQAGVDPEEHRGLAEVLWGGPGLIRESGLIGPPAIPRDRRIVGDE